MTTKEANKVIKDWKQTPNYEYRRTLNVMQDGDYALVYTTLQSNPWSIQKQTGIFWQQVSKNYSYFATAQKELKRLSKKG